MTEIELNYGRTSFPFTFDEARFRVLGAPESFAERPLTDVEIGAAIDDPIDCQRLEEIISAGESVLIVVSDATRATASAQVVNLLVRRLIETGVAPFDIHIIFATGIHRAVTSAEKRELLTPFIVQRIKTLDHDAHERSNLTHLGATERGTPVVLNRALTEHDHIILTGGIAFHYFAGFTGGRKSICPGLAGAETVAATHILALDFERGGRRAGVGTRLLEGNSVHEECERVAEFVEPSFLINAATDERGRAVQIHAGHWRRAHARACAAYCDTHTATISSKRALVIASCGGAPFDVNLIQAHKTLDMAAHACREGGAIILIAECAEGFGRADFLKWFEEENSHTLEARLRAAYEVNGQTAWSLLLKAEQFRIHLVSNLAEEDVRRMRMIPARSLDQVLSQTDMGEEGFIMPRGASLLPVSV